ncbi:MAG: translation elongation factor Ts [Clostridia bacterium]|nr:translation elongation factor Ts [Clostridia bacterium]
MSISAQDVKALREKTGIGMMECKKALTEAEGDMDKAVEILRERGLAVSQKKSGRIAAEGIVYTKSEGGKTVIVEVNSESDFVAKNEKFLAFVDKIAATILEKAPANVDELAGMTASGSERTVTEELQDAILVIGENLKIRRFEIVEGPVATYIHMGGAVGVVVSFETDAETAAKPEFTVMGKDVAMQVAAMNPEYLSKESIPAEELEKLRLITVESALNKPDSLPKPIMVKVITKAIADGMISDEDKAAYEAEKNNKFLFNFLSKEAAAAFAQVAVAGKEEYAADPIFNKAIEGRVAKQLKEICLLDQPFVKDDSMDVRAYVANSAKAMGASVAVKSFIRYAKGEGIEKKEEDFASEVAAQIAKSQA